MEFPTEFNYGHLKYQIIHQDEMNATDGAALGGQHRLHEGKIFITTDHATREYMRIVMAHEIIHCIEYTAGLELTEPEIHGISFGIIQALRQNKWLADYLMDVDNDNS